MVVAMAMAMAMAMAVTLVSVILLHVHHVTYVVAVCCTLIAVFLCTQHQQQQFKNIVAAWLFGFLVCLCPHHKIRYNYRERWSSFF